MPLASYFGALCPQAPDDLFTVTIRPGDQMLVAAAAFDPSVGTLDLAVLACDQDGCAQALDPHSILTLPGLRVIAWRNAGTQPRVVGLKTSLATGGDPALPYLIEIVLDDPG